MTDLQLSDADIIAAMEEIPGFIDISTADFREIYTVARRHATAQLFGNVSAASLMRTGIEPLDPRMHLDEAAAHMARQGYKGLPVVDGQTQVMGMLTESDFLRRLQADTFVELLVRLVRDPDGFSHRCHESTVREAMKAPAVTVNGRAGFQQIIDAFRAHPGRSMPVVDDDGRLLGLLMRKDFVHAGGVEDSP